LRNSPSHFDCLSAWHRLNAIVAQGGQKEKFGGRRPLDKLRDKPLGHARDKRTRPTTTHGPFDAAQDKRDGRATFCPATAAGETPALQRRRGVATLLRRVNPALHQKERFLFRRYRLGDWVEYGGFRRAMERPPYNLTAGQRLKRLGIRGREERQG